MTPTTGSPSPEHDGHMPGAQRPRWRVVLWRVVWACVVAVALYAAAGFLAVPPLVKHLLQTRVAALLDRTVDVERAEFNPFTLHAAVRGVRIAQQAGEPALLELDALELRLSPASLRHGAPVLTRLRIDGPRLHVVHLGDKRWSVSDLVDRFLARPARPMPRFSVANIELAGGHVDLVDQPTGAQHVIASIEAGIPFLSSLPVDGAVTVQPRLTAVVDGAVLRADAQAAPFSRTRASTAHVRMDAFDATRLLRYLPQPPLTVNKALLDAELALEFEQPAGARPAVRVDGSLALRELDVTEPGGAPLLRSPAIRARFTADPMAARVDVSRLTIERPSLTVHRRASDVFIVDRLVSWRATAGEPHPSADGWAAGSPASAASAPGLHLKIAELLATGVAIDARDERGAAALQWSVQSGRIALRGLDTAAGGRAAFEVELAAQTGERVTASGQLAVSPLQADGRLQLAGIDLPRYWPYVAERFAFEPVSGTLELKTDFRFGPAPTTEADASTVSDASTVPNAPGASALAVSALDASVQRLALRRGAAELVRAGALQVSAADVNPRARTLRVGRIDASSGVVAVGRDRDGRVDWAGLMGPGPAAAASNRSTAAAEPDQAQTNAMPWTWAIGQVGLRDLLLEFRDAHVSPAVRTAVNVDEAQLGSLASHPAQPARLVLRARTETGATLAAEGTVQIAPHMAASLDLDLRRLPVVPLAPYYAPHVAPGIARGLVSGRGRLELQIEPLLRLAWRGGLSADEFRITQPGSNRTLLRWQSLALSGITLAATTGAEPLAVDVGSIAVDGFFARLVVSPQGRLNLQDLARGIRSRRGEPSGSDRSRVSDLATTPDGAAPTQTGAPRVRIGPVTLRNGAVEFTDQFVRPNYSANLQSVEGTVAATTAEAPGAVRLQAKLDGYAPVQVEGRFNPLAPDLFLELTANVRGIDLPSLSTYSEKYAGYGIERGKLSMSATYRIEARQLSAENRLTLDQLTFGPKVDSPAATQLPVRLLVSLLQDRHGTIDLRLPISGSLDDPQFSMGAVVRRALGNLVTRIVSSPFAFLASLAGGSAAADETTSSVTFDAGAAQLSEQAQQRLGPLAQALVDRPALKVDLVGYADASVDREALAQAAFDRRLRMHKRRILAASREGSATPLEQIRIEPDEYTALVAALYQDTDLPGKPRAAIGPEDKPTLDAMEQALRASIQTTVDDLRALATARARAVERALSAAGVSPERLFVAAPRVAGESNGDRQGQPAASTDKAQVDGPMLRRGVELVLR